jgi:MFS family permease
VRWSSSIGSALRERNLRLLVAAGAASSLGNGMAQVALAFAVLRIGSAADLGYTFLAREIPIVVFLLVGGVWADRVSRKWLLVLGDLATGTSQAATALLFLTSHATVPRVAALQVVFGVASAFTRPAATGVMPQAVSPEHLQSANALFDLSRSTMRIVGPALGGLVVVAANPGWALAADAGSFIISAALRLQLRLTEVERQPRTRLWRELSEGWAEFRARTWCWTMVSSFGLFQLTLFPSLLVLGPVVARNDLGGAGSWGAVLSSQAAGSVVGGLVALHIRPSRPLVASALLTVPTSLLLALLGIPASTIVLCAIGFVASLGLTCGDIIWFTTFQKEVPDHLISRLSSFDWFGSVALNPLGYALIGPVAGAVGVGATLYGAAALNGAVSVAVATSPSIRSLRTGAAKPAPA